MASSIIGNEPLNSFVVKPNGVTIQGTTKQYSTYYAMLEDPNPPKYAIVLDASGDPTVDSGRANYTYENGKWVKIFESEAMDREMDHTHANVDTLAKFSETADGKPLWNSEPLVLQSKLEEVISSLHVGDLSSVVTRLANKFKYRFVTSEGTIDLQEQTYIVRGVRFTGRLPDGSTMPEDVSIRLIVDADAAPLGGGIMCASQHDTINGANVFRINAAMDVTIIYDRAAKNWMMIGTSY